MRCLENQKLCILRGQAIEISIPVIEQDRQPADLAGATAEFGLSASPSQPYEHVVSTAVEGNTITASISSALSAQLGRGMYYFSCWVTISGASTPVARGFLTVTNDSRSAEQ